ncbi:hypothetical protein OIE62_36600 [Streptomyces scopuliridis]|uniref:Uncharacterized protein n=1 Tax=Streptomyces scopuliridis TaxID=452529 RepID=A0ACD4ZCY8_9ACTN|nr:hypothetical protein [Streptomyces scopuliridis]WSB96294.1 hypothetical protein OG835_04325 [Streptomyces scopuliridis]WSC10001.1 hypothetical protein OIE62_36600 [Streptomyces scopuliridis]
MNGAARYGKGGRGPRPGVVLLTVLAALLHVLGCAHGPVSAAPVPSAAMPTTAVAPQSPALGHATEPVAGCAGRASHGAASCTDADEPSVLPQRPDASVAPLTVDGPDAADTAVRNPMGPRAHAAREDGRGGRGGRDTEQRRRAALGVWRN